jgi:ribosomal protein S18 acetylase RimI-like enzyme
VTGHAAAYSLRSAERSDEPFLRTLFATVRADQFAPLGLSQDALDALLAMQYEAQDVAYRRQHPEASHEIVEVDGAAAGRLVADRSAAAIHVLDVALLPHHRGRGLGTALLRELQVQAGRQGRPVTLTAIRGSRALSLYDRLGFTPAGDDGVYVALEWRAS